ncbi:interferon-induced, double-stranded RNA-activated protein kinase-like isoform X1 [Acipenser oxyrinchus oxyrinchus]|uniref:non-specific serine/threonine protein kinase n=1 Tax=Acipenser oxyrinchus oxyrinchus TaxID=40147 RepID=A0AAD8GBM4_ACIOX|nr:interferon-induced, double-stranded RNA-activated protein kinase-like isoform X1 [Acipenser oxyrinchus oxyrinchus]
MKVRVVAVNKCSSDRDYNIICTMAGQNYVSELNEYKQKNNVTVIYEEVSVNGPDHDRTFTFKVIVNGVEYPEAIGKTKKDARHYAAREALEMIHGQSNTSSDTTSDRRESCTSPSVPSNQINCVSWLNEYCQQKHLSIQLVKNSHMGPAGLPHFSCQYNIGNREYPEGKSNSKKEAKKEAARLAYEQLQLEENVQTPNKSENDSNSGLDSSLDYSSSSATPVFESQTNGTSTPKQAQYENSSRQSSIKSHCGNSESQRTENDDYIVFKDSSSSKKENPVALLKVSPRGTRLKNRKVNLAPDFRNDFKSTPNKNDQENMVANLNMERHLGKDIGEKINFYNPQNPRLLLEFEEITSLGKGGFGSVYKARNKLDKNMYAVKRVKYEKKAEREVAVLARLEHDNIVRYSTAWFEELPGKLLETSESYSSSSSDPSALHKYLLIQMKLYEKGTLKNWIDDKNHLKTTRSKTDALKIFMQMVDGVEYIHSNNLIHRDLKPRNIFLSEDDKIKIGDFGLATEIINENDGNSLQRTKRTGTVSYMSPEQENQNKYENEVDIFSLGLILFELLWRFETESEKFHMWSKIRAREFPEEFCTQYSTESRLIKKMLSETPKDRPKASKIAERLDRYFKKESEHKETKTV